MLDFRPRLDMGSGGPTVVEGRRFPQPLRFFRGKVIHLGILNCSRQWGKSTVMAIKAVHPAYFVPESQVLVVSPTERPSGEHYPAAFLEVERRRNEAKFRQEYLCEFVHQEGALFDEVQVRRSLTDEVKPFVPQGKRPW